MIYEVIGHTISGNEIRINATKEKETFLNMARMYWSKIEIVMNGHEMNIDDLSERNIEHIMEQLPCL